MTTRSRTCICRRITMTRMVLLTLMWIQSSCSTVLWVLFLQWPWDHQRNYWIYYPYFSQTPTSLCVYSPGPTKSCSWTGSLALYGHTASPGITRMSNSHSCSSVLNFRPSHMLSHSNTREHIWAFHATTVRQYRSTEHNLHQ